MRYEERFEARDETSIIVNGVSKIVNKNKITHEELVMLTFGPAGFDDASHTITYRGANNIRGSLLPKERIAISDGMIFNIVRTGKA